MTRDELLALAERLTDPRFAEPVAMLVQALQDPGAEISGGRGLLSGAVLRDIYVARRDWNRLQGNHVPGLDAFVDVLLAENPETAWRLPGAAGAGMGGCLFVTEAGEVRACVANRDARTAGR